jgi:FixJ family two-component response regulator
MTQWKPIVYLVDDDAAVLKALRRLLTGAGHVVRCFESPEQFLGEHDATAHGCAVLDVSMPQLTGLDLQRELAERGSTLPILFLTGRGDIPDCVQAMRAGAVDFLRKPVNDVDLFDAVNRGYARSLATQRARAEVDDAASRLALLTPRERQVLTHLITGKLNKQIAADLGTVEKTIKVHRARVLQKMEVSSIADLVRVALLLGIRPDNAPPPTPFK